MMVLSYCNRFCRSLSYRYRLFLRPCKGILACTQFDTQRRPNQVEGVAEMLLQEAFVRLTDGIERIAVDDDDGRILAALVRVAHLRAGAALALGLLLFDRFLQRAGQARRRQVGGGG